MSINDQVPEDLHGTIDAQIWAQRFMSIYDVVPPDVVVDDVSVLIPPIDAEALMNRWFTNAIEVGKSAKLGLSTEEHILFPRENFNAFLIKIAETNSLTPAVGDALNTLLESEIK